MINIKIRGLDRTKIFIERPDREKGATEKKIKSTNGTLKAKKKKEKMYVKPFACARV